MSVYIAPTFVPGDIVYLKSGSPRMTVLSCVNGQVSVIWSDYNSKKIERDTIPDIALVKKTF